jgi:hypothetical protein
MDVRRFHSRERSFRDADEYGDGRVVDASGVDIGDGDCYGGGAAGVQDGRWAVSGTWGSVIKCLVSCTSQKQHWCSWFWWKVVGHGGVGEDVSATRTSGGVPHLSGA